jgi:hypothetical protein
MRFFDGLPSKNRKKSKSPALEGLHVALVQVRGAGGWVENCPPLNPKSGGGIFTALFSTASRRKKCLK